MLSELKSRLPTVRPTVATGSIFGFGLTLIAVIWLTGYQQLADQRRFLQGEQAAKVANLAITFEQNVAVASSELDRILLYVRQSRARAGQEFPWQELIREGYMLAEQTVQIAVIDAKGMMITSTAMLYPDAPVDLSDREHFKFHALSSEDVLFISRPVIGRASGKKSVQFARRLETVSGEFAGVIVVSLDPDYVTRTYGSINLGHMGGMALKGVDEIIRAGTGRYKNAIGESYKAGSRVEVLPSQSADTTTEIISQPEGRTIVATRRVAGYPLNVVVSIDDIDADANWQASVHSYYLWCFGISLLALTVMLVAIHWQARTETLMLRLARHDSLTEIPNRLSFQKELEGALRDVDASAFALHLIDLDDFKPINDHYGHQMGDKLLHAVAKRLEKNTRSTDVVARLGGDEFAILQRGVTETVQAERMAERLTAILMEPFFVDGKLLEVGGSIGYAYAPADARSYEDLIWAADLALYNAKSQGGRLHQRYMASMTLAEREQRELECDLRHALSRGELQVHYQPIMCTSSLRPIGFEALLRWNNSKRGFVPPSAFIPVAERSGLINPIGKWVIEQACRDAMTWPLPLSVAVNCSPVQFSKGLMPVAVEQALSASKLPPARFDVEITESTLMRSDEHTLRQLDEINRLGVMLSLDDFGTGYSSLSCLQNYPIRTIKIDRSFVSDLESSNQKVAIIRAIAELARSLNLKTVVEGIETAEQLRLITEVGTDEAQGFYFSKPMPASQVMAYLAQFTEQAAELSAA